MCISCLSFFIPVTFFSLLLAISSVASSQAVLQDPFTSTPPININVLGHYLAEVQALISDVTQRVELLGLASESRLLSVHIRLHVAKQCIKAKYLKYRKTGIVFLITRLEKAKYGSCTKPAF